MITLARNVDLTRSACPVLDNEAGQRYLAEQSLPPSPRYRKVPPGVVVRGVSFWLRPKVRLHPVSTLFLVTTDLPIVGEEPLAQPVLCYRSSHTETLYLGRIVQEADGAVLEAILPDLHPSIPLASLIYAGRMLATC